MRGRRSISSDGSSVGGGSDSNDDLAATTNDDDDSTWLELDDLVPLSIDTPDYTDDNIQRSRLSQKMLILIERCSYCCNRRYLITIIFIFLCIIGSVALVLSKRFHQSLPNLLHIFGGKHSTNHTELICLSTQLLEGNRTTVENMNLNQVATAFYNKPIGDDNILTSGFLWSDEDAYTSKWRPQGVTTMYTENGFRFALVSWYGRADEGYADRGGRVSFVDMADMPIDEFLTDVPEIPFYNYRHVLLVDENFCTLPSIHVGGIEYQNGTLYVADSRKGQQAILEFEVANDLYEVPSCMASLLGYRYVLRASSSFHTPIKPSFFSYDIDNHKFIVGTYAKCGKYPFHEDSTNCFNQKKNNLLWFDKDNVSLTSPLPCDHYFPEMQGAVSLNWEDTTVIWTSSSYGAVSNSHLHAFRTAPFGEGCPDVDLGATKVNTYLLPPGLEDLHIEEAKSSNARFMWMQTEFGVRQVFTVPIKQLLDRDG
ncbi:hypothetical protein QTG54_011918 [Skeletonema marinoi]|uniref:Uncharacterized protein n=1 Tax=Skeletonema marinoi TaxID=267567 RepID=A0AAD8Y247_9STRA|nr:hypothetical protein QTG54_011918 [Skeletonema marinoi]